jgi:ABC-type transporter Mla subunit MlaD
MGDTRSLLHTLQKEGTAADLSLAVKRLNHVLDTLDRTLADVDAVVKEDRAPLKVAVEHASGIAAKSDELLAKRQAEIDKSLESLKHLPAIMTELEGFVTEIKRHPWRLVRKGDPPPEKPKKP